jgi:hypothetical protein
MEYKIYGEKLSFNGGIQYVESANDKLRALLQECKTSINIFHYFCKNSFAATNMTFQRALICQQKIKNLRLKKSYISSQK